jgi:alanine racemase
MSQRREERPTPRRLARARIEPSAIADNWRFFAKLAPSAICAAVVKADGYGLGAETASRALAAAGARVFFTATVGEAEGARRVLGEGPRIFVFNGPANDDVERFAVARLIPVLNSMAQIALWNGRGPAALHVDTGMNRLGLGPEQWSAGAAALGGAKLELLASHLACASTPSHEMNARQRARFIEAAQLFPAAPRSLAASAGALIGADYHFDMIRPGIGLYGGGGLDDGNPTLAAAATVEAPILQVREVAAGESFGYGATATAQTPMRVATAAIGYADGYLRSLSGAGYGVLAGARLPILGRVSMDLVILDASAAPAAAPGAMVEFLGAQARLDDVAARAGTAPYEILTALVGTVRRGMGA